MADDVNPIENPIDEAKSILESKTFWTNLLGPVFLWLGTKYGVHLDPDTQTVVIFLIMSVANIGLRLVTTQPAAVKMPAPKAQ